MGVRHYILIAMLAVAGCAMGSDLPSGPVDITVRNRSQFELLELRFHSTPSWAETVNVLGAPLGIEETLPLVFDNGSYVTAMRRKIEVGEVIAVSSAEPLPEMAEGDVLIVFDLSFRIEAGAPIETPEESAEPTDVPPYNPPMNRPPASVGTSTATSGSMR